MAIVELKPDAPVKERLDLPEMIEAPEGTNLTALVPEIKMGSLIKYVEGYPWTVDYYGQLLGSNNTLNHFDPNLLDLTQSYVEIKGVIIQVDSPISSSYDSETGTTKVTGNAISPFGIKPNVGDLFIAQVDTGEDAFFVINNVERLTHRKETLYSMSYELYSYVSSQPNYLNKLKSRVNETYFFNPDTNFFNRDILIKPSTREAMGKLKSFLFESRNYYFRTFIQKQTSSLCIPGVDSNIYDPLLANFISKTMDLSSIETLRFYLHTLESVDLERPSILSNLVSRTMPHRRMSEEKYGFCDARALPMRSRLGTLTYTGIDYVLYPLEPIRDHLSPREPSYPSTFLKDVRNRKNYTETFSVVVNTSNSDEFIRKNLLPTLFEEGQYIVSEGFYRYVADHLNYDEISYVELLIYKFLKRDAIPKEDLLVAINSYKDWSFLHQFYILPVMWLIIKDSIGAE